MLQLAGQRCDGAHLHVLHSVQYLREYAWPHIEAGLRGSGRTREHFSAASSIFVVPTDGEKAAAEYEAFVKNQLSFYMSTPAYRSVLELHGWVDVARRHLDSVEFDLQCLGILLGERNMRTSAGADAARSLRGGGLALILRCARGWRNRSTRRV